MNSKLSYPPPPRVNSDSGLPVLFTMNNTLTAALNPQKGGNKGVKKTLSAAMRVLAAAGAVALCLAACENITEPEIRRVVSEVVYIESGIKIETAEQLAGIGLTEEYPADGEYYLANDIDLSVLWEEDPDDPPPTPYVWHPIGSTCRECEGPLLPTPLNGNLQQQTLPLMCGNSHCPLYVANTPQQPFSGILHGNGYTISGLLLPKGTDENGCKEALYMGLFGYIYSAYIHDLTVKVANTNDNPTGYAGEGGQVRPCLGTLAGLAYGARIENVNIKAENDNAGIYVVSGSTDNTASSFIGGVIGEGINASLKNVTSSARLDVKCENQEIVGGIAGMIRGSEFLSTSNGGGEISGAKVTGDIKVENTGQIVSVAGICPFAGLIRDCEVTVGELSLYCSIKSNISRYSSLSGIGGNGTTPTGVTSLPAITDCAVDIGLIKLAVEDTTSGIFSTQRYISVGGISASTVNVTNGTQNAAKYPIERCSVRFGKLEVTGAAGSPTYNTFIGGVIGQIDSIAAVSDCQVYGGEIAVDLAGSASQTNNIGGIAGAGNVSDSSVSGLLKMSAKTGVQAAVYTFVGGITGNGTVSNSSIGGLNMDIATTHTSSGIAHVGGIAGQTTAGGIQNASITGGLEMNINAKKVSGATFVGGITGYTLGNGSISNAGITGGAKITVTTTLATATGSVSGAVYAGGIAGQTLANGSISNANITGGVEVTVNPAATTSGAVYAGGIAGQTGSSGNVSNAAITGGANVTVNHASAAATTTGTVYAGGIAGQTGSSGNVSNAAITGGVNVTVKYASTSTTTTAGTVYAGGIAGQTSSSGISRGSITGPSEIKVETATLGPIYAGGLVGSGIGVEYSFIGTKNEHAKVNVTKTNTGTTNNLAYIGGISGQAALTAALPFQYNYAFCDVTLETTAATTTNYGQLAGGLVGYVSANQPFTESFAAGSVSIADNNSAGTANRKIQAGGIAGYAPNNMPMTKCAALDGPVVINHSNASGTSAVYWRRIAFTNATATTAINASANNITTITGTVPADYQSTMASSGKTNQDGFLVTGPLTKDTFFGTNDGQLGWNEAVWEWDGVSGYPVLK